MNHITFFPYKAKRIAIGVLVLFVVAFIICAINWKYDYFIKEYGWLYKTLKAGILISFIVIIFGNDKDQTPEKTALKTKTMIRAVFFAFLMGVINIYFSSSGISYFRCLLYFSFYYIAEYHFAGTTWKSLFQKLKK